MRRLRLCLLVAATSACLLPASLSFAQFSGPVAGGSATAGDDQADDQAKSQKRKEEFGDLTGPLPALKNAGPCPYVKTLYDAARYLEFKDDVEASASVRYTGEIENIHSACSYKGSEPVKVAMQILFELGRGPQADSSRKTYRYWVAVTDRNHAVLAKEFFDLPVTFPAGHDRVSITDSIKGIQIPRATSRVSGSNFEILTGFEVTPEMADFNRLGKRFKADAGVTEASNRIAPATP